MKTASRTLTILGAAAWIAFVTITIVAGSYGVAWWIVLVFFFVIWILARLASRDLAEKRGSELDEYEMSLRNRARNIGYWIAIFGGVALFVLASLFVAQSRDGDASVLAQIPALILALVIASSAAPTLTLAWNVRADVDE